MVTVEIADDGGGNDVEINRCQEFEVVSITVYAKKPIKDKDIPTIDDDAWVAEPKKYIIGGYVTAANRRSLELKKQAHDKIQIEEDDVVTDDGYIIGLKSEWRGQENYAYPWYVTITIISSDNI